MYQAGNISQITGMAAVPGVTYIDKHPQPTRDTAKTLQLLLQKYAAGGGLDARTVARNIPRLTESGDVHVATYDFANKQTYIAIGRVNTTGQYGEGNTGMACYQPIAQIDQQSLWRQ